MRKDAWKADSNEEPIKQINETEKESLKVGKLKRDAWKTDSNSNEDRDRESEGRDNLKVGKLRRDCWNAADSSAEKKTEVEQVGLNDLSYPRSFKRSGTLFKSLLFWLAGEVSWLAVEVLSPC